MSEMYRLRIFLVLMLCVAALLVCVLHISPEWTKTAGLDFWNLGDEEALFQSAKTTKLKLQLQEELMWRRIAEIERIADCLYEHQLTLHEAIDAMRIVADTNPEWFAHTKRNMCRFFLSSTASDRDVLAYSVIGRIEMMRNRAESNGEMTESSAISTRLIELEAELLETEANAYKIGPYKPRLS